MKQSDITIILKNWFVSALCNFFDLNMKDFAVFNCTVFTNILLTKQITKNCVLNPDSTVGFRRKLFLLGEGQF